MMQLQVLLVAGTHGNEINGIWLFEQWEKSSFLINTHGIKTYKVIGNPEAKKAGKRYIYNDLNRSFLKESFTLNHILISKDKKSESSLYKKNFNSPLIPCGLTTLPIGIYLLFDELFNYFKNCSFITFFSSCCR